MKIYKEIQKVDSATDLANYCITQYFINNRSIFGLRLDKFKDMGYVLETCKKVLLELPEENYTDEYIEEFFTFADMFNKEEI